MKPTPASGAAAIKRPEMSRPIRLAFETRVIEQDDTVLDYGCGHGEDLRGLEGNGIEAFGWDPVHIPEGELREAAIVNLSYVINVIESPAERREVLRAAWGYARKALVVAVRTDNEARTLSAATPRGDGWVTSKGTFQRFYGQAEARDWLDETLGVKTVPLSVGVFVAFKNEAAAQAWLDVRQRERRQALRLRRETGPRETKRDRDYAEHAELLAPLETFLADRGRLPDVDECSWTQPLLEVFGSLARAFQVVRHGASEAFWESGAAARGDELRVRFGLARIRKRPKFFELPRNVQRDVKALFGSYKNACEQADALLFSAGDLAAVTAAAKEAPVGKLTPEALYVHTDFRDTLPVVLQVYVGCAETLVGNVVDVDIVKLHLDKHRISFLSYPNFDKDPHPALAESWVVNLRPLDVAPRDYRERANPPVLHRKELFVGDDYPLAEKFARLTAQKDRHGLLDEPQRIGTRQAWEARLAEAGWTLRGHRLVRARGGP